ncbi:hypothetical protein [Paenibacillus sp. sgz302251]
MTPRPGNRDHRIPDPMKSSNISSRGDFRGDSGSAADQYCS